MPYQPVLLANINKKDSHTLAVYRGRRGLSDAKVRAQGEIAEGYFGTGEIEQLARTRRGGLSPPGLKWSFLARKASRAGLLSASMPTRASRAPSSTACRWRTDPHQILEGILLSCYATRAATAYIYLRYEYPLCLKRMQAAIDEAYAAGYLGKNILKSPISRSIFIIHRGAAAYVCGEETGLDRKPRRQARLAADQAAVSRRRRAFSQADGRE